MTDFYVKVKPGQSHRDLEMKTFPTFLLEEPAENGRANAELLSRLEEILGQRPAIVSGHNSRRKKLRVDMAEEKVQDRIEQAV
ncbi:MAG: DUF167 domain-containing protein [Candidatus Nanohalobium sp.]